MRKSWSDPASYFQEKKSSFVASLIDWRLFENPFVNLADIFIPVTEFIEQDELFAQLPDLVTRLSQNVVGGIEEGRTERVRNAWADYDELYQHELASGGSNKLEVPSVDILSTISRISFERRHLRQWPVWTGESEHGTALLVSHINYDLQVQLDERIADASALAARDRFFETLSSFVDPFVDPNHRDTMSRDPQFSYVVRVWEGDVARIIVGSEKQFDRRLLDGMEHLIEGKVDVDGVFTGRIKAFGQWVPDVCAIDPPKDLTISRRADASVGPFELYIASMEFVPGNTTHTRLEFQRYRELAQRYSGFMMFRDGLRVLPYGRTDNDFFEIDITTKHERRT